VAITSQGGTDLEHWKLALRRYSSASSKTTKVNGTPAFARNYALLSDAGIVVAHGSPEGIYSGMLALIDRGER